MSNAQVSFTATKQGSLLRIARCASNTLCTWLRSSLGAVPAFTGQKTLDDLELELCFVFSMRHFKVCLISGAYFNPSCA
jgi:hypothetical protein